MTIRSLTRRNAGRGGSYFTAFVSQNGEEVAVANHTGTWKILTNGGGLPLSPAVIYELQVAVRHANRLRSEQIGRAA